MSSGMYEVCVNSNCPKSQADEHFAVGTSVCQECGQDTETRGGGLTQMLSGLKGSGQSQSPAQGVAPQPGDSQAQTPVEVTKVTVTMTLHGVEPHVFEKDDEKLVVSFSWDETGVCTCLTPGPMMGSIVDNEVTIGVLQPHMTYRPTWDLSAMAAWSPNVDPQGNRIPVAVSRHMATVLFEDGMIRIKAGVASNRPRKAVLTPDRWKWQRSMSAGEVADLANEDLYALGSFIIEFHVTKEVLAS